MSLLPSAASSSGSSRQEVFELKRAFLNNL
jgi:hypothetical protein